MIKKYLFSSLLVLSLLISPLIINAQSPTDIASQIAELRRQIAVLQEQLARLQGQSGGWCYNFNQNLRVGDGGQAGGTRSMNDVDRGVAALLQALTKEQLFNYDQIIQPGTAGSSLRSSLFSESTAAAVSAFQLKYWDEILAPLGLSNPTGYVGPSTRKVLNRLYGCRPVTGNRPPSVSGVSGPTALNVNQTGTWTVQASDPENGTLSYSVTWGDENFYGGIASRAPASTAVTQTATFTHSYERVGTYTPIFVVTDNAGQSARTSLSITVGSIISQNITVLTPNGGEQWVANSIQPITWRYHGATSATKVDLYLQASMPVCPPGMGCVEMRPQPPIVLDKNINANAAYNWIVATDVVNNPIPSGNYKVRVCSAGSQTNCDSSDNYFTLVGNLVGCTADARQCSNGSWVGRVAPNCEFAVCP